MIVTCEQCGKKYRIDPGKIKGSMARFKCKSCGQVVTVQKPAEAAAPPPPPVRARPPAEPTVKLDTPSPAQAPAPEPGVQPEAPPAVKAEEEKLVIEGLSIRSKITIIIVALVFISLGVAGFIASYQSRDALSAQAEDHLLKNARQKSREYGLTFDRIKDEVLGMADYASVVYRREDVLNDIGMKILMPWTGSGYGNAQLDARLRDEKLILQQLGLVLKSMVSKNPYLSLGYVGTETKMTVFDNEDVVGVIEKLKAFDVTQRPWYKSVKEKKGVIWTEPYVDANTKKLTITCAAPAFRSSNEIVAVVGFDVLLDTIQKDILTMDIGYDSYALLLNRKGSVLVRPGMKAGDAQWDSTYKTTNLLKTDNPQFNNIVRKMIRSRFGVDTYDAGDEVKYMAYAPLRAIGASMAVVASKDEVIKPAVNIRNFIIGVFVVVLLISILIGLFIGNNITKPINNLTTMANLISQGKRDLDVLTEDRKDEIGVLTKSFNRLVISLKLAMSR